MKKFRKCSHKCYEDKINAPKIIADHLYYKKQLKLSFKYQLVIKEKMVLKYRIHTKNRSKS